MTKATNPDFDITIKKKKNLYYVDVAAISEEYFNQRNSASDFWILTCHEPLTKEELYFGSHYSYEDDFTKKVQFRARAMPEPRRVNIDGNSKNPTFHLVIDAELIQKTYLVHNLKPGGHDSWITVVDISSYIDPES